MNSRLAAPLALALPLALGVWAWRSTTPGHALLDTPPPAEDGNRVVAAPNATIEPPEVGEAKSGLTRNNPSPGSGKGLHDAFFDQIDYLGVPVPDVSQREYYIGPKAGYVVLDRETGDLTFSVWDPAAETDVTYSLRPSDYAHLDFLPTAFTQYDDRKVILGGFDTKTRLGELVEVVHEPATGITSVTTLIEDTRFRLVADIARIPSDAARMMLLDTARAEVWEYSLDLSSLQKLADVSDAEALTEVLYLSIRVGSSNAPEGTSSVLMCATVCNQDQWENTPMIGAATRVSVEIYDLDGDGVFDVVN